MHTFNGPAPEGFTRMGVYGTLKKGFRANDMLMANAVFLGEAITDERGTLYDGGFPAWIPHGGQGHYLIVEVYDVPEADVPDIDGYEGHPNLFRRAGAAFLRLEKDPDSEELVVVPDMTWGNIYHFNQKVTSRTVAKRESVIGLDGHAVEVYRWVRA